MTVADCVRIYVALGVPPKDAARTSARIAKAAKRLVKRESKVARR